ncbi:MAG TPA: hypothetical protein VFV71_04165 [Burkholderiales bacterium]|nr:hypothetical protein [Burkholderiales bacterium]
MATAAGATERGYMAKTADLLDAPAAGARRTAGLAKRQSVDVLGRSGSWARVQAGASVGWVRSIDLRLDVSMPGQATAARVKPAGDNGIRGFSEEELVAAATGAGDLDKFRHMGVSVKDAAQFARAAGLKPRKQDYFESTDLMSRDLPADFFDE